ncbi:hypothetical protein P7266_0677 [Lactococcus cremoris]|nr:hypothetical protein P7266_0677 [Lactococcus cremoris]
MATVGKLIFYFSLSMLPSVAKTEGKWKSSLDCGLLFRII